MLIAWVFPPKTPQPGPFCHGLYAMDETRGKGSFCFLEGLICRLFSVPFLLRSSGFSHQAGSTNQNVDHRDLLWSIRLNQAEHGSTSGNAYEGDYMCLVMDPCRNTKDRKRGKFFVPIFLPPFAKYWPKSFFYARNIRRFYAHLNSIRVKIGKVNIR